MKLDFSSDNSAIAFVEEDFAQNGYSENGSNNENAQMLRAGIKAAQRGDRSEARQLLMRVTEAEPNNESAWLWLASISEYPEELLIFLNNVLDINPENERAIEWAKATKSLLAKTFVQRGIEANRQEQKQFARQCFMQAIVHDNRNDMAWLWLASITDSEEEKIGHLNRVLEINPENETARESIRSAREKMLQSAYAKAETAVNEGDRDRAEKYLKEIFASNPQHQEGWFLKSRMADSFEEKIACFQKLLEFNHDNETARQAILAAKNERVSEFFAKANDAVNDGNREQANEFLTEVFAFDPQHENAWLLKSRMTDSFEEKIACFERILEFNPANETAQAGVKLRAMLNGNMPKAEHVVSFPNEEIAEQSFNDEFDAEPSNDANLNEENSYCAGNADEYESTLEENSVDARVFEPAQESDEEMTFASFDSETASIADETREFGYFAETREMESEVIEEEEESFEGFSATDENGFENEFAETAYGENLLEVKAEENHSAQNYSENSYAEFQPHEATTPLYAVSAFEKPEEVFAEYAENYGVENFPRYEAVSENYYAAQPAENFAQTAMNENGFHTEMPVTEELSETENIFAEQSNAFEEMDAAEQSYDARQSYAAFDEASAIEEAVAVEDQSSFEEIAPAESFDKPQGEVKSCPFCKEDNEMQAFVCRSCRSILTLSDMEMILAYQEADQDLLKEAVERMEVEDIQRGLESAELTSLAIGHINLKNLRKGLDALQRAARLDPNNVVVVSQANSLAIRLSEIEEKESVNSSMPKDRTIMVVDDSATVRKLISGKLEKCGHIVITAVDGMDAMAKLGDVVPDLILLDITMPRMDGYQVCKLIRSSDSTKEVPVVMISGKDGFFDKVRGRMAGTTGYITKPFGPETLMKMLDTYLV